MICAESLYIIKCEVSKDCNGYLAEGGGGCCRRSMLAATVPVLIFDFRLESSIHV